jgi:tripartite-type tricarboxylate transporter receptor subunit TctC
MDPTTRNAWRMAAAMAGSMLLAAGAVAQGVADNWPAKPVRLIVPLAAGGPSDTIARIVAGRLSEVLGQNVVVDNRAGASGIIGTEITAKAPPDGYTLALVSNTLTINPALVRKMPYDTERDLVAISQLTNTPYLLTVHRSLPVKTVREFIALAKVRPGELNHASGGSGTGPHLGIELFAQRAGIKIVQIVYKGGGPAMIDFLAGHTQFYLANMVTAMQQVRGGRIRALAVSSLARSPVAPEIPTIHESGLPDFDEAAQQGVVAPAALPKEIVAKLHAALVTTMRTPEIVKRFADEGSSAVASTPDEYRALIRRDSVKWQEFVRKAGIKPE